MARKFAFILILAFAAGLLATPAHAQFTLVTGTVKDSNGYAYSNGTISAQIIPAAGGAAPTLNGASFTGVTAPVQMDGTGSFTMRLADNNVVSPAGSQWKFTVNFSPGIPLPLGTGAQSFSATITITGSIQSISSTLQAAAAVLTNISTTGSSIGGANTIYAATYGPVGDGSFVTDAVDTNTTTITSATAHWLTTAKIGQCEFGQVSGALEIPYGTITGIASNTSLTVSVAGLHNNPGVTFKWGTCPATNDTAFANYMTAYTAAAAQVSGGGQKICGVLPTGDFWVSKAVLISGTAPIWQKCMYSAGHTIFTFPPPFDWTTCSISSACAWDSTTSSAGQPEPLNELEGVTVECGGVNTGTGTYTGLGAGVNIFFYSQGIFTNDQTEGCGDGVTGLVGAVVDNFTQLTNVSVQNSGSIGVQFQGGGPIVWNGGYISNNVNSSTSFSVAAGSNVNTHGIQFGFFHGKGADCESASTWTSDQDTLEDSTSTVPIIVGSGCTLNLHLATASELSAHSLILVGNNGVVNFGHSTLTGATNQKAVDTSSGGVAFDDCTNSVTGASDAKPTANCGLFGVGTGVGTAGTTLYLVGPTVSNSAFTNTTATTAIGIAPRTGTLRDLICAASAAGTAAGSGVVTVGTAALATGTFSDSTITATFGTGTTAVDQTHTVAVTQGQPIRIKVTTQAMETLAGVSCQLVVR